jgi:para-nitrobenzyl esterase
MNKSLGLVALALIMGLALKVHAAPVIRLVAGSVKGVSQPNTDAYFGIPYAQPPVGSLRWRDPQPVHRWHGVRNATQPAAACFQSPPREFGPFTAEFLITLPVSENCLYLNVWKPRTAAGKLPVYFFIHGGGFGSGSANIPIYDGSDLAARGVVVVTINYRVGVFGFLAHPELTAESSRHTSGNYGLLDMVAALRWTRANIARFGGDPANITISGQSAGAAAVNDLILSPQAVGLFQRAIAESGSGMGVHALAPVRAEQIGSELAAKVSAHTIAELRQVPPDRLQEATNISPPTTGSRPKAPQILFAPNVDGVVLVGDREDAKGPLQSAVPLLTGFNTAEGLALGAPQTPAEFEAMVRERYGAFADRYLQLYPHASQQEFERSLDELARDRYMAGLVIWTEQRTLHSGQAVYTYLYDHPYPPAGGKGFGAFHTAEVPYVFGALRQQGREFTARDHDVARQMQDRWIAFMSSGDPSLPGSPWPKATAHAENVMALGDSVGIRPAVSSPERLALFREFVASGGQLSLF